MTYYSLFALPFWNKVQKLEPEQEQYTPRTLTFKQMVKTPSIRTAWIVFFATCALEFTCGFWGASYLVKTVGLSEETAAGYITLYYLGIALSRIISGLVSNKIKEHAIIFTGVCIIAGAMALLLLPVPPLFKGIGLLMIGLGNGPTFPNLTCLVPNIYGKEVSQSIIGTQMVACNLGICLMPPLFGVFVDIISLSAFPFYLAILFVVMVVFLLVNHKQTQNFSSFFFCNLFCIFNKCFSKTLF